MGKQYYVFKMDDDKNIRFVDQVKTKREAEELCGFIELEDGIIAFAFKAKTVLTLIGGRLR